MNTSIGATDASFHRKVLRQDPRRIEWIRSVNIPGISAQDRIYTFGLNSYLWANHVLSRISARMPMRLVSVSKQPHCAAYRNPDGLFNICHPARTTKKKSRGQSHNGTTSQKARSAPSRAWNRVWVLTFIATAKRSV